MTTTTKIAFSMNDYVRVKLTETGKKLLVQYVDDFNDCIRRMRPEATYRMKLPDLEDGVWLRCQFWSIMKSFEKANWHMGAEAPFMEIELVLNEKGIPV